jgi:hypothetical protein
LCSIERSFRTKLPKMQVQSLDIQTAQVCEALANRTKFYNYTNDNSSFGPCLPQLQFQSKMEYPQYSMPSSQQQISSSQQSAQNSGSSEILAPQKVRTERYVKVSLKGLHIAYQKSLFLSWFLDNNGLPDSCLLLIPERHPNVIINFKTTHGWIEVETKACVPPEYEVQFDLKLHHATLNQRRYAQSHQPVVLRFYLMDKREDGSMQNVGEVILSLLLMSSKCPNRTLIAHLLQDEKQDPYANNLQMGHPQMPISPSLCLPLPVPTTDIIQRKMLEEETKAHATAIQQLLMMQRH